MKKIAPFLTLCILLFSSISFISVEGAPSIEPELDTANPVILEMIDQVDEQSVFDFHDHLMLFGPRYTGTENCRLAGEYIFREFEKMGLEVAFHHWEFDEFTSENVVGTLPGTDPSSNAVIIMSAHYDCTPGSLGADDDASGVAAIMEAARIMSQYSFNHTIRFVAFSGEEVGTFGSFCYARDAAEQGDNILAVINLDMVGYANTTKGGRMIRFFVPERAQWIYDYATTMSEKYEHVTNISVEGIPNYIGADHQAFIDYGYDAVFIAHYDGYPWGNSPDDTPDHMNWTYETKATKFCLALVAELASNPVDLQVMITRPYEGYGHFFDRRSIPLGFGNGWHKGLCGLTFILGRTTASADVFTSEELYRVVFCIDGNFMFWDYEPPFEWKIQGKHYPPIGKHTLKVYAYTTSGKVATDELDMFILTWSCQYGRW